MSGLSLVPLVATLLEATLPYLRCQTKVNHKVLPMEV